MKSTILDDLQPISETPQQNSPSVQSKNQSKTQLIQSPLYQSKNLENSLENSENDNNDEEISIVSEYNNSNPNKRSSNQSLPKDEQLLMTDPEHIKEFDNQKSKFDSQEILRVGDVTPDLLAKNLLGTVKMEDYFLASYKRVNNNILNALTFLHKPTKNAKDGRYMKERIKSWKDKLLNEKNQLIINDGFWLVLLKKNKSKFVDEEEVKKLNAQMEKVKKKRRIRVLGYVKKENSEKLTKGEHLYKSIENAILDRMAVNFILFLDIFDGKENEKFFEVRKFYFKI